MKVIKDLADIYPQLYLDPDKYGTDDYRSIVLKGDRPETTDLSHFASDPRDKAEHIETPAGEALVVTLYDRHDFEFFIRCMMAAKDGPEKAVPATMGASTLVAFNWPRINAHKEKFFREQHEAGVSFPDWAAEFRRFREVKENYMDSFIVLSRGPYSNTSAEAASEALGVSLGEGEWTEKSDDIRKYHELTHFVCRKLFPERIDAVWDELVADAAGIFAALGGYSRRLEELFLGIEDGKYTGGRLGNYLNEGEDTGVLAGRISEVLRAFEIASDQWSGDDVFGYMLMLEEKQDVLWKQNEDNDM